MLIVYNYLVNSSIKFTCGFALSTKQLIEAVDKTNQSLNNLPSGLYRAIDYKTTSSLVGCILCENIAQRTNGSAIVNPIEKGHPDIVPSSAQGSTEEQLRNYPNGLEVKCTVGSLANKNYIDKATSRVGLLTKIIWQAHHQEVTELLGVAYDYFETAKNENKPLITGLFYSDKLNKSDWGAISGTSGRNTKVCAMTSTGIKKMGQGWVILLNNPIYIKKYSSILKFSVIHQ